MSNETEVATQPAAEAAPPQMGLVGTRPAAMALTPTTIKEAIEFAEHLSRSSIVPKDFQGNPGNILVAIQWGAELGLAPMQAMQSIAVINGRPQIWGDTPLALVRASGLLDAIHEDIREDGSTCTVKRRGAVAISRSFTLEDAKRAKLAGKDGTWQTYPKRMMQLRARAFALRDEFTDVLRGMPIAEETMAAHEIDITPQSMEGVRLPPPAETQPYPDAKFAENLPVWRDVIASGRKTADEIIATANTKGTLSEAQKARIRGVPEARPESGAAAGAAM